MTPLRIFILYIMTCSYVLGQNTNQYDPGIRSVPTSPEVALLGRFGDIPVGHYTGTANVSVPLYNLKVDNIEIPLVLSYHTSGIKVADEATWVGLGWNFMPEGTITQEIRGREDFVSGGDGFNTTSGYSVFKSLFSTLYSENQLFRLQVGFSGYNDGYSSVGHGSTPEDSNEIIIRLNEKKGQPDIFTYNFHGYSGKFFYNPENNSEILFLESNDDVKFARMSEGWLATTNKGDKYYFNAIEKSKSNQTDYTDIGYTFKITQIILTSGKIINFFYQDESTYQEYPSEIARFPNFTTSPSVNTSYNATINQKKTLIKIETEDTKVEFNLGNREDIKPASASVPIKKLNSIDISSRFPAKKIKSFVFNHSYFPTVNISTVEDGYKNKRLKLNSIQEVSYSEAGSTVLNISPYIFDYETTGIMHSKLSNSDFYGYYNGTNNGTLLPDLSFFNYLDKPPYKNYNINVTYPYYGANKYPNFSYVTANILKKISYPTGARTELEYESNTFSNQFIPTAQQAQSANKDESISHRGASTVPGGYNFLTSPLFKLPKSMKINFSNTIFDGYMGPTYPQTHYNYYQMLNCGIKLYKRKIVNGQQVDTMLKEWKVDVAGSVFEQTHQQKWDEDYEVPFDNDPTTEYYVYVSNGIQYNSNDGTHFAVVSSRFKYYDDSGLDKSISFGHGARVKSVKNYENNTLLSHKEYTYSGGKLIYPFQPIGVIKEATAKSQPTQQTGGCFIEPSLAVYNELSVNSSDFGLSGNKPFGYDEVTEKDINIFDGTSKGATKYKFTNNLPTGTVLKGIPKVDIPANGENVLIEKFDQAQNRVSSTYNSYETLTNSYGVYPSFSMINTSAGPYDPTHQAYPILLLGCNLVVGTSYTGHTYSNAALTTKYNFIFNPLITGKRRLKTKIDNLYFGNKTLVDRTDFTYTDSGNLDITTNLKSDGKTIVTDYDYAYDVNNTRLINKFMNGIPLSIEVNQDGKQVSHVETKFDNLSNYLPSSVLSSDLHISSMATEVIYDRYDSKGNLLQFTTKDGVPVTIVYGYNNTKPILKIEDITYDQAVNLIGFSDIITKSNEDINQATENIFIDALDLFRKNNNRRLITTYTYNPLIGVTSITPPSGIREVYLYDSSNRLKEVRENNSSGKVIKEYKYNYKQ